MGSKKHFIRKGERFGRLIAVEQKLRNKKGMLLWTCQCDCGNKTNKLAVELNNGNTRSCGCLRDELKIKNATKHNMVNTRIYNIWTTMKQRCYNKNNQKYKNYGGRGITVCDEWLDKANGVLNFYNWSKRNGYNDKYTLDRINVNGNYEPNNCRWVDMVTQQNNRRNNTLITINNITKTSAEWEKEYNLRSGLVGERYRRGWTGEELLKNPILRKSEFQSGIKGITWLKKTSKWQVRVRENGVLKRIGLTADLEEAKSILIDYKNKLTIKETK
ncbi:hypothetical protein [Niallia circulans]|uniref:hypothetical protein n=1 Tax=Niallia circulans TaxID=1397 RepID=UPI0026EA053B|nr:hypothetical protein [Niallia circulans]